MPPRALMILGALLSTLGLFVASPMLPAQTTRFSEGEKLSRSASSEFADFGWDVSLGDGMLAVGAVSDGSSLEGSVTVFNLMDDRSWLEEDWIQASDKGVSDSFGQTVNIGPGGLMVGAPGWDGPGATNPNWGAAYHFTYDEDKAAWVERQRLEPSEQWDGNLFGRTLDVEGDIALISAPYEDVEGFNQGVIYLFRFEKSSEQWLEQQRIRPSDPEEYDRFGLRLALSEGILAANAKIEPGGSEQGLGSGQVCLFHYDEDAVEFVEDQILDSGDPDAEDDFGWDLALDGGVLVVAADRDDSEATDAGAVYVFRRDNDTGDWTEEQKLVASDAVKNGWFGHSVAVHGDAIVVLAPLNATKDGAAAYLFKYDETSSRWFEERVLVASDAEASDSFGHSISVRDGTVAIGAPHTDSEEGVEVGGVYLYDIGKLPFLRGDADGDGDLATLTDAVFLLRWQFAGGEDPPCADAADVDGNNDVSALSDALFLLRWQFAAGDEPPAPGTEECGIDPDLDSVTCFSPTICE